MLRRLVAAALLATGCASPEPLTELPLESTPEFTATGTAWVPDEWWTAFDDDPLDARVDRALADNFTLAAAWERINEARAIVEFERSALVPQVDGFVDGAVRAGPDVERSSVGLGLVASYEVDLWGRISSIVESEQLRAAATAEDYEAAAISLSAEVALTWFELAESQQQLELINSQIETNQTVLEVLQNRFAVGQSGSADVLRQRQLLEATREQALIFRARADVQEHRLAVLEGRPPQGAVELPPALLPEVPELPATGLPSELLQRRPDVRSAQLLLEASDADVAAAVADQYPRIDLAAALTTAAETPSRLFESWLASLAGQLVAPLYDGGRRRAEVDRTVAVRSRRLAEYGDVVLNAFEEVENALTLEAFEVRRIRSIEQQLDLAEVTSRRLGAQYLNGVTEYLDVLTALIEQQQLERRLVEARLARVAFRVALYRALAGGFDTPRSLAAEDQASAADSGAARGVGPAAETDQVDPSAGPGDAVRE